MLHCCSQPGVLFAPCHRQQIRIRPLHTQMQTLLPPQRSCRHKPAARTYTHTTQMLDRTRDTTLRRLCSPLPIIRAMKKEHCWRTPPPNTHTRLDTEHLPVPAQCSRVALPACSVPHPAEHPRHTGSQHSRVPHTPEPQHTECSPPACHLLSLPRGATRVVCLCCTTAIPGC